MSKPNVPWTLADISESDLARFRAKVAEPNDDGCMLWLGDCTGRRGYGRFRFHGKRWQAHRFAFVMAGGVLVDGMQLDHVRARGCRSRACVNPAHLEQVTCRENIRRGDTGANNAVKTHCPHGHEYTPENTKVQNGGRACRACLRIAALAYYYAHRESIRARAHASRARRRESLSSKKGRTAR